MSIHAVIGANWGDEGKGLLVDYLSGPDTLVVRFSGGAQAGHTVTTPAGVVHEFHQYGAGTFRGARTHLSRFMLINPILFVKETTQLLTLDTRAGDQITVDPRARVTTPFDMFLNRALEIGRGNSRHGSCGLGINETVVRCETEYALTVQQLLTDDLYDRLVAIQHEYMPRRLSQYHWPAVDRDAYSPKTVTRFLENIYAFLDAVRIAHDDLILADVGKGALQHIVFEGAQGLRLDEESPDFPHVTRSRTGLTNVLTLLEEAGRTEPLDVHYVTRPYVTRHGAGPLPGELPGHPYGWTGPETNTTNVHQGPLRYAKLIPRDFRVSTQVDLVKADYPLRAFTAMTCLDQVPELAILQTPIETAEALRADLGMPVSHLSYGPTRADVWQAVREPVVL